MDSLFSLFREPQDSKEEEQEAYDKDGTKHRDSFEEVVRDYRLLSQSGSEHSCSSLRL